MGNNTRFSMYFETEEDYIEWQESEAKSEARRVLYRQETRKLKAERIKRRPVLFSEHTISKSVAKKRPDDAMSCTWIEETIEPIVGTYIGYRYKFDGEWKPEPDNYYEPGGGHGIFEILREHGASIDEAVLCVLHIQVKDRELASEILVKYGLAPLD